MPAYQRLGPYNQHCREDRREPAIELDKEQAVAVVEPDATPHFSLQHPQLLPERGILGFKSDLGLDECRQQVEGQKDQCDHDPKRDVIPSPVQCGRGFRYTQVSDFYRELAFHGGIPETEFLAMWLPSVSFSTSRVEDLLAMAERHPLFDDYWVAKNAELEKISVPAFVVASWGDHGLHHRFEERTELTGYMKLRLWVHAEGSDDMDMFVAIQKIDRTGDLVPFQGPCSHRRGGKRAIETASRAS